VNIYESLKFLRILYDSVYKSRQAVLDTAQECENDPEELRVPKNRYNSRAGHFDLVLPTLRISIFSSFPSSSFN